MSNSRKKSKVLKPNASDPLARLGKKANRRVSKKASRRSWAKSRSNFKGFLIGASEMGRRLP